jgi:hypothetical protein
MSDQKILDYIRAERQRGLDDAVIKNELLKAGWRVSDVESAFRTLPFELKIPNQPLTAADLATTDLKLSPTATALQSSGISKSKKLLFALVAVLVIVLAGGGVTFGYYYFFSPFAILNKTLTKMTEIKTFEYSMEMTNTDTAQKYDNFTLKSSGVEDISDFDNTKSSITLSGTSADDADFANPIGFQLDYRNIGHNIYMKLDKLDGLEDLAAPIINRWIQFDLNPLKKEYGLDQQKDKALNSKELAKVSAEQRDKLKEALKADKVFEFSDKFASEEINGVDTHHYKITLNKEGFLKFYTDAAKILFDRSFSDDDIKDMRNDLLVIGKANVEIWVGKKDSLLYKMIGTSQIIDSKTSKATGGSTLTLNFKNYNKSVSVSAPTDTISFEEAFKLFFK